MKKFLVGGILIILLMVPMAGASNIISINNVYQSTSDILNAESSHTAIVEYGTMTTCGPCVIASSQLYSIYNSGDLDFHYVSLVWNIANSRIRDRLKDLGVSSVPDVFFDGKYKHILGAQTDEQPYRNAINQSSIREVPDIDIDVDVTWIGGGTLKIEITVVNNEPEAYNGHLRTYIAEKESRWNDNSGNPYHYAALDIPIDKHLAILGKSAPKPLGDTYTFTKTWFGGLQGFGDIEKDNIVVISAVFDIDTDYAVETALGEPITKSNNHWLSNFPLFEKIINNFPIIQRLLLL
jgi:hypothetical protein